MRWDRYWGWLTLAALVILWWAGAELSPVIFAGLWLASVAHFLLDAPVWCGAITREGKLCRKNARGLLFGCTFQQHKWQKLELLVVPRMWREFTHGFLAGVSSRIATLGLVAAFIAAAAELASAAASWIVG